MYVWFKADIYKKKYFGLCRYLIFLSLFPDKDKMVVISFTRPRIIADNISKLFNMDKLILIRPPSQKYTQHLIK